MSHLPEKCDWSKTTFEGAERENLRMWQKLSFDEKLRANEEMNEMFDAVIKRKKEAGEPYIDPETGERVPATRASQVPEPPATDPKSSQSQQADTPLEK